MTSNAKEPVLTFVVPVRHQDNAADWSALKRNLTQTLRSLSAQDVRCWQGVVVANKGADLPEMPEGFRVEYVTFPPNKMHDMGSASREEVLEAFRLDKGRRVLSGMLAAPESAYFMIVDDDDFVSSRLARFVSDNAGPIGWKIDRGFIWNDGTDLLFEHDDFNHVCGSSLIIRGSAYNLPTKFENADMAFVKQMMGSHHGVDKSLASQGTPLVPVPFRAAVYRVAHAGSHSQVPGILRKYVFFGRWKRHPLRTIARMTRLRYRSRKLRREFFGD